MFAGSHNAKVSTAQEDSELTRQCRRAQNKDRAIENSACMASRPCAGMASKVISVKGCRVIKVRNA